MLVMLWAIKMGSHKIHCAQQGNIPFYAATLTVLRPERLEL